MAEKKVDKSSSVEKSMGKKVEKTEQTDAAKSQAKPIAAKSAAASGLKATTAKVSKKAKQVAGRTASGAAKVGKAAQELSEGLQKKLEKDISPAAERARKSLSETTKKVREELSPAAEKARKSLTETSKKVREELGPAAEKAGKGLSAVFKATARATRKSARILGIKASISGELRKRHKLFAQLGETYFRTQKKKTPSKSDKDALSSLLAEITKANAEIQALEAKEKLERQSS
ncbi:MAG: hypothetical protein JSV89_09535 [Spirochaetaceae bacterium]|nr:MAG: hypothetical protein JSV89_09535 [Spirochaetaceae bacterium]